MKSQSKMQNAGICGIDPARHSDCLSKNNYNEARCQGAIRALYDCCAAFYDSQGDQATSASCPKPNLLRLKLKQLDEGK